MSNSVTDSATVGLEVKAEKEGVGGISAKVSLTHETENGMGKAFTNSRKENTSSIIGSPHQKDLFSRTPNGRYE